MSNSATDNDEFDLIELAVIWFENIKFGIAAAVLLAVLGGAYALNLPNTLIISSNIVIGNQLNGSVAINAADLAQILKSRYNLDNEFSDSKLSPPYLQQVLVSKHANMLQLGVIAHDKSSGAQLLQQIITQVLHTYNDALERERQQATQHISTLKSYIKQVQSNKNMANNVDLTASYNAINKLTKQIASAKASTTIPLLPDFYSKAHYSLSKIMALMVILCVMALIATPLLFAAAKHAYHRFKAIRKLRSAL